MNSIVESFGPTAATMGGGFFLGVLIGYALKKVIKIAAVIVGLFLAGLAYLQYQQVATINWNKLQTMSEGTITTLSNAIIIHIPGISGSIGDVYPATISIYTYLVYPIYGLMFINCSLQWISIDNEY